jgi:hypothetical protein
MAGPGNPRRGTVASADHRERAGWADASSPCPSARARGLASPVSASGGDHGGSAMVPAVRVVLSRRGGAAGGAEDNRHLFSAGDILAWEAAVCCHADNFGDEGDLDGENKPDEDVC